TDLFRGPGPAHARGAGGLPGRGVRPRRRQVAARDAPLEGPRPARGLPRRAALGEEGGPPQAAAMPLPGRYWMIGEPGRIAGRLRDPGVVPVYGMGADQQRPFFTMKLVRSRTLGELLRERLSGGRTTRPPRRRSSVLAWAVFTGYTAEKVVRPRGRPAISQTVIERG